MDTEIEILKQIRGNKGKLTQIRLISIQAGLGTDYVRYICKNLLRRDLISSGGRDLYLINRRGEKELERKGLIKSSSKVFRGLRPSRPSIAKLAFQEPKEIEVKVPPVVNNKIERNLNYSRPREEKLSLGKKVEKAVLSLEKLKGAEGS